MVIKEIEELIETDEFKAFMEEHCIWEMEDDRIAGGQHCGMTRITVILKCPDYLGVEFKSGGYRSQFRNRNFVLRCMALCYLERLK